MRSLYLANSRYISAYPVFLSRHHSRLTRTDVNHQYSDKCVSEKLEATADADNKLPMQFTKLFTRDSVYIFVQVFLICNVERRSLNSDPLNYSILSIVFEVVRFVQILNPSRRFSHQLVAT